MSRKHIKKSKIKEQKNEKQHYVLEVHDSIVKS